MALTHIQTKTPITNRDESPLQRDDCQTRAGTKHYSQNLDETQNPKLNGDNNNTTYKTNECDKETY